MKTIKKTYFRIINKIIAIIAAFTGLQACGISIHPMYAPPAPPTVPPIAELSVSGRVENRLKGPIPFVHINLETTKDLTNEYKELGIEYRCDELGKFDVRWQFHENSSDFYNENNQFEPTKEVALILQDLDGEQYGEFKNDTIIVPLEFKTDSTSSYPYAEVTNLVITLEEKEQNNEEENKQ